MSLENKANFQKCYDSLGTQPGCSWRELRSNYKKLMKKWHPDRFQDSRDKLIKAENRVKDLTSSYRVLSNYYKQFGELPTVHDHTGAVTPPGDDRAPSASASHETQSQEEPAPFQWNREGEVTDNKSHKKQFRILRFRYAVVLAGLIAGYYLWGSYVQNSENSLQTPQSITAHKPLDLGAPKDVSHPASKNNLIAYGSSMGDVHEIQGNPTKIEGNTWYFDKSYVKFRDGKVIEWSSDVLHPLKTDPFKQANRKADRLFGKGSTKEEVMRIQGKPVYMTDTMWDYGASKIYFSEDKVVSWYNSVLTPLKIR